MVLEQSCPAVCAVTKGLPVGWLTVTRGSRVQDGLVPFPFTLQEGSVVLLGSDAQWDGLLPFWVLEVCRMGRQPPSHTVCWGRLKVPMCTCTQHFSPRVTDFYALADDPRAHIPVAILVCFAASIHVRPHSMVL